MIIQYKNLSSNLIPTLDKGISVLSKKPSHNLIHTLILLLKLYPIMATNNKDKLSINKLKSLVI